jgi:hypothetical protein
VVLGALGVEAARSRKAIWIAVPAALIIPLVFFSQFEGRFVEEPYLWLCLGLLYAGLELRGIRFSIAKSGAE